MSGLNRVLPRINALAASAAIHVLVVVWLAGLPLPQGDLPAERQVDVVILPPPAEDAAFPGLKPLERSSAEPVPGDLGPAKSLAGADLARIAAHIDVLFPFVVPGLAIEAFFPAVGAPATLIFENPYRRGASRAPAPSGRPLPLDEATLQKVVDKAWSRGERWKSFSDIREYIDRYSADDRSLARLIGWYRERNALQPYADGDIRDLRLWAQLGLAADHVAFIRYIREYTAAHPSSKVTTELLFLLDTLAQANQDALATLIETDQQDDLLWTRVNHPRAYLLARQIQDAYGRKLATRGLVTRPAVDEFYERGRLALLTGIARTTPNGYRANDAKFLIGSILWKQGQHDNALRAWREIAAPIEESADAAAVSQIRTAVLSGKADARNIDFILANVQGRWLAFSDDRLRKFGYRFDTY